MYHLAAGPPYILTPAPEASTDCLARTLYLPGHPRLMEPCDGPRDPSTKVQVNRLNPRLGFKGCHGGRTIRPGNHPEALVLLRRNLACEPR